MGLFCVAARNVLSTESTGITLNTDQVAVSLVRCKRGLPLPRRGLTGWLPGLAPVTSYVPVMPAP